MSWQKCPICIGSGINPNTLLTHNIPTPNTHPCTTCKGFKIINELTGLPPKNSIQLSNVKIPNVSNNYNNFDNFDYLDKFNQNTSGNKSIYNKPYTNSK